MQYFVGMSTSIKLIKNQKIASCKISYKRHERTESFIIQSCKVNG